MRNHYLTSKSWWFDPWCLKPAFLFCSKSVFKRGKGHLERHKPQLIRDANVHRLLLVCPATLARYYWKYHKTETHSVYCSLVKVCQNLSVWEWKACQVWSPDFPVWLVKDKLPKSPSLYSLPNLDKRNDLSGAISVRGWKNCHYCVVQSRAFIEFPSRSDASLCGDTCSASRH